MIQRADSYEYDDCDNLIRKTAPGRDKSSVFYYGDTEDVQKKHQLLPAVAPEGTVSTYAYDAAHGNLTASQNQNAVSNPSSFIRTETNYTADGNYVATQTDARGKVVTTVTDPNKGTVTSVTDPKGQTVVYSYDALRRVTHVNSSVQVNAQAGTRSYCNEYGYDKDTGLLSTVSHNTTSNDCDVTYSFGYDALGRKTTVNVGNVELSRNEYQDNASQPHYATLKKMTYGNGNTVENTYDDFNRVTAVHYNGEETPRYEYAYNAKGQVAHVTHNTTDDSGAAVKVVTESEYDLSDRPIRVKEHEGSKHVYSGELAYNDEFGVLSEFREKVGESRAEFVTTLSYDDQNRPIAMGYGSYGGSTTTIDKLNRMTYSSVNLGGDPFTSEYHFATGGHGTGSLTGLVTSITQSGGNCSYGYDDNGNIASATVNGKWAGYAYDALGQLVRVNDRSDTRAGDAGSTWVYEYDQGGNILSKKLYPYADTSSAPLQTTTFTYGNPNWKDQLTAVNGVAITYDQIGNPLNDGTWTYTWQNGRQLAGMSKDGMAVSFKYNASGLRTRKIVNGVVTKYTLHGKNVVHMTRGNDSLHFFYDAQNRPAVVVYNGTAYAYVKNLQGDIIAILDSAGAAVVSYTYDAWGVPTGTTGSMAATLGVLNPFRYRGYVFDEETQLYYLRTRYYNSAWCRFSNADAIFGRNMFGYCGNEPITYVDVDGLSPSSARFCYVSFAGTGGGEIIEEPVCKHCMSETTNIVLSADGYYMITPINPYYYATALSMGDNEIPDCETVKVYKHNQADGSHEFYVASYNNGSFTFLCRDYVVTAPASAFIVTKEAKKYQYEMGVDILQRHDNRPPTQRIRYLQRWLAYLKFYSGVINGIFDEATEEAVMDAQRHFGLDDDGMVGPLAMESLSSPDGP